MSIESIRERWRSGGVIGRLEPGETKWFRYRRFGNVLWSLPGGLLEADIAALLAVAEAARAYGGFPCDRNTSLDDCPGCRLGNTLSALDALP